MTPLSLAQGRGKTTLLSVLRNPSSALPENVSTVGVEVAEWVVHPPAVMKKKGGSTSVRVSTCTAHITNCTVFGTNPLLTDIKSYPFSLFILLIARYSGVCFQIIMFGTYMGGWVDACLKPHPSHRAPNHGHLM